MPQLTYILSPDNQPVSDRSETWKALLPLDRLVFTGKPKDKSFDCEMRYGDYFRATRIFLEQNRYEMLTRAVAKNLGRAVNFEEIQEIRVCLEKHGQFYHPARIITVGDGFSVSHVLNVAVSQTGKDWIEKEYINLKKLNKEFSFSYLPAVFGIGDAQLKKGGPFFRMFLGEWFEGFNEFHVSKDTDTDLLGIRVWDYDRGDFFLSPAQTINLYRQMTRILTYYYNIETFEQIFSWHHAAGDFVARFDGDRLSVRLVSARQYLKLFNHGADIEKNAALILEALLIFFLNLSIRMRLDRLDGTGPIVWSGHEAVTGMLLGFFDALAEKPSGQFLPGSLDVFAKGYLMELADKDLLALLQNIVATYSPDSPDMPAVRQNLDQHAVELYRAIQQA